MARFENDCLNLFAGTYYSLDHEVIEEIFLLTKPIKFGVNGKKNLYWSVFAIEPIADFCPFLGYWQNGSQEHSAKGKSGSLTKPIALCTIEKRTRIYISLRSIVDFCLFLRYWPSKNRSRDHNVKGNLLFIQNL